MKRDRTGTVLTLLVFGTTVVVGAAIGAGDRLVAGAATLSTAPLTFPSDLGASLGLAVLFLGTVVLLRRVVAP